ncbi:hypothetical protein [Schinkia azotoformans]|uniref:hypothetical protein n=1 Tax=Schinkia azotoformans TaxID=1454 RepID=UPI002DBE422F|nr:hypothetical protein [Schinkia azotoformans]MEC1716489.1 hypothetical protein [Schinkia azotoformans]MEC1756241.1 hypothetical protein [Schinkia azotoformans]
MLNTLFSLFNMKMQYDRGYSSGVPGFVALLLVWVFIYFFEPIYNGLNKIGFIGFLKDTGIIHPIDGGITIWRLFVAGAIIVLMVTLALVGLITLASLAPFLANIIIPMVYILASPFIIIDAISQKVNRVKKMKRMLLKGFNEGNAKEVTMNEASKELDRFPFKEEYFFYLCVTKNQEVFALVPRPAGMAWTDDEIWGVELEYPKELSFRNVLPQLKYGYRFPRPRLLHKSDILFVIENRSDEFMDFYKYLVDKKFLLLGYADEIKKEYKEKKLSLLEELALAIEYNKDALKGWETPVEPIQQKLDRLTEIERRETPTIFKEGWIYARKLGKK